MNPDVIGFNSTVFFFQFNSSRNNEWYLIAVVLEVLDSTFIFLL